MLFQKTMISAVVALAISLPAVSYAEWKDAPEGTTIYQAEDMAGANNPWIKTNTLEQSEEGFVFVGAAVQDTTGANGNALLLASAGQKIINKGSLWVIGNGNGDGMANMYNTNGTIVNDVNGKIYVTGSSVDKNKAMTVNPQGTAINNGSIVVKDKASGLLDASGTGSKTLSNAGTIEVVGNGVGINYRMEGGDDVKVSNSGTISVTGSGTGVQLTIGKFGSQYQNKNFTNSGDIVATGDNSTAVNISSTGSTFNNDGLVSATENTKAAIYVSGSNAALNFGASSQVDGLVDTNSSTTLSFTDNTDTISLADDAQAINTTGDSNVTIVQGTEQGLEIGSVDVAETSSLGFRLNDIGTESNKVLTVDQVTGNVGITYTGTVSDKLADGADAKDLFNGIQVGADNTAVEAVTVEEGLWGNGGIYYSNGDVQITNVNSLLSSTTDLALMNGLVWRSQLTNLSDRMGTLRTMPQAAGAWARYNNGRLDGRGIQYDYNTIEVGFDAPVSSNFLVGVALDYTIGETDLNAGSADNDTYTLGLYGTYFGDNGGFVDLMAKIGRIDNEYDISNNSGVENGDYMMTGAIVGVEAGHRFDLAYNTFVEPQVQLSYSWLRASDYSTNIRSVDFETVESLVARVGVMGGIKFAENRGAAYLKASYNHDFLGDVDAEYTALDGSMHNPLKISDELDDNWAEVSLGLNYSVTDQFNTFLDVGTGFGGDIDQKWRVNVGARYTF